MMADLLLAIAVVLGGLISSYLIGWAVYTILNEQGDHR